MSQDVSEWLRCEIRASHGPSGAGSNPNLDGYFFSITLHPMGVGRRIIVGQRFPLTMNKTQGTGDRSIFQPRQQIPRSPLTMIR